MMKIVCCVFFIALTVGSVFSGPEEFAKYIAECKTSEKASDADVTNMKNKVQPPSKEVKCLTTCLMEKMGILSNNQINKDGCLKVAKMMPNANEKTIQNVTEMVDECKLIKDTDRCEYGAKATACLMEAGAKRQMTNLFM